jgi:hypothetical protein
MFKNKSSHQNNDKNAKRFKKSDDENNDDNNSDSADDEFPEKIDYNMPKPGPHAKVYPFVYRFFYS